MVGEERANMTLNLQPYRDARDRLLDKIEDVGLDDESKELARREVGKFIVDTGIYQAAWRGDDPEKFVREQAKLAIASLRTDALVEGDTVSNAVETLKRALDLPGGY